MIFQQFIDSQCVYLFFAARATTEGCASVAGMFENGHNEFVTSRQITSSDTQVEEEITSPFDFEGQIISSSPAMITKNVFLTAWNVQDAKVQSLEWCGCTTRLY